jgi:glycosyltransferase involved in cell wall biosynthesis
MRIICFTESLAAGGAQRQLVNLAVMFKRKGHDVRFLVYRKENFFLGFLKSADVPVDYVESTNKIERLIKCRRYLRGSGTDIVLAFLETPGFISCFSAMGRHRWKLVTTELSAKESTFKGKRSRLFIWFQRYSDRIVCNSLNAENLWRQRCPQYAHTLSTIYNPVLLPDSIKKSNHHLTVNKRRIVIPASYQYLKNPIRLIEAVAKLPKDDLSRLDIEWYGKIEPTKGHTEAYDEACRLVKKYALESTVHLFPETPNIYEHMQEADAIGLFSVIEGLPNAVCEGMALGKPIIMTRVSDYKVFAKASGVFLCEAESVDSIKSELIRFINADKDTLSEMGRRNQALSLELFDGNSIVKKWEALFSSLLQVCT